MTPVRSLLIAAAALAAGCAGSDQRSSAPATPQGAQPTRLAVTAADFADTDQNSYRDTTTVVVYVSADPYPIPVRPQGRFRFTLEGPGGRPLATWDYDAAQTEASVRDLAPGPGGVFELSLLRAGSDRIEAAEGVLTCTFYPARGGQPLSRSVSPVLIGPTGR